MKGFIFGFISAISLISILLFYLYKKLYIEKDVSIKRDYLKITRVVERNTTIIRDRDENLSSDKRIKIALAKSDFVLYPTELTLIGLKYEKILEVWGRVKNGKWRHITDYKFTAFSGRLGPKLKEGDRQIPEGIYGISYLNPNSKFHLSLKVSYPNSFDKKMAKKEKRVNLGGDIMIHGSNRTIGCIPIGDKKIEELYFLAEKVGIKNIKVIISPVDFRHMEVKIKNRKHPWWRELYSNIKREMVEFK